jgi:2-polyprenyl-3-methyl-5-hydroxy-6-metoxy-1,4-benzoquinol methylase
LVTSNHTGKRMKSAKHYFNILWDSSPSQIVSILRNKCIKKSTPSEIVQFIPYRYDLINLVHQFISEKYPASALTYDKFKDLILAHQNTNIIRKANGYVRDLWELFKPDYSKDFDEYYRWHDLILLMTCINYANRPSLISEEYVKDYNFAIDRLEKFNILEIGGGIPHGLICSVLYINKNFCTAFANNEMESTRESFVKWFADKHSIPYSLIKAKGAQTSSLNTKVQYDFIVGKGVFEHLDNPNIMIDNLLQLASDRAILSLDLEDKGSPSGQHISPNLPPLKSLLIKAGYKQIEQFLHQSIWMRS